MNYQMDYFYGHEANQFTFFRIPKLLFSDERFIGLTSDAKILYGLMLDRMGLSVKNEFLSWKRYYKLKKEAIEFLGTILWGIATKECLPILNGFVE